MYKLGFSVYVSHFEEQKHTFLKLKDKSIPIFTSLHIEEEVDDLYIEKVTAMCGWLKENGFYVIADVSPKSLAYLKMASLNELIDQLQIDNIRLDYGFETTDLEQLEDIDLTYNASTVINPEISFEEVLYMHNFYPRPETGLSDHQLMHLNQLISEAGGQKAAFLTGDEVFRGPVFEGLPTLEKHRQAAPYAQFVDLINNHQVDIAFIGDVLVSDLQLNLIKSYIDDDIIKLPVVWKTGDVDLCDKTLTVRVDSPDDLFRIKESRAYAKQGAVIEPYNTSERLKGTVTMDNKLYKRYSGEVQILKQNYPSDERVNVIGRIPEAYHLLLDNLQNGDHLQLISLSSFNKPS